MVEGQIPIEDYKTGNTKHTWNTNKIRAAHKIIAEYKPDIAVVETIFYGKNIKSAFTLGHARGVIILALAQHNIEIEEYSPREVKKSVVGNGNASKEQVEYMVQKILNLDNKPETQDAADALAIALCQFNKNKFKY